MDCGFGDSRGVVRGMVQLWVLRTSVMKKEAGRISSRALGGWGVCTEDRLYGCFGSVFETKYVLGKNFISFC